MSLPLLGAGPSAPGGGTLVTTGLLIQPGGGFILWQPGTDILLWSPV
jgi:hypothetical protein